MKSKSTVLRAICIGSSLTLMAAFVLYRAGVLGRAVPPPVLPTTTVAAEPPSVETVEPAYFPSSKSGPIIDKPARTKLDAYMFSSKSGRVVQPEDVIHDDVAEAGETISPEAP